MTLFGPDLSHFQAGINLAQVKAEGCTFVICKVSQGATWRDPAWPGFRDDARLHGLELVGYHMVTRDDPAAQAANCRAALGDPSIPLGLDWEESGGSGDWSNFMRTLGAFRGAGLNVRLAYAPRWYWQQQGSPDMRAAGLPLWASRYVSSGVGPPTQMYPAVQPQQWDGYGGLQVGLLQFTDRAHIAGKLVDCNAYRGTPAELHALLYPTTPGGPAPVPATLDSLDAKVSLMKPGVVLPSRSGNCRSPGDDHFGATLHAWAEAADARALAAGIAQTLASMRGDIAALAKAVQTLAETLTPKETP